MSSDHVRNPSFSSDGRKKEVTSTLKSVPGFVSEAIRRGVAAKGRGNVGACYGIYWRTITTLLQSMQPDATPGPSPLSTQPPPPTDMTSADNMNMEHMSQREDSNNVIDILMHALHASNGTLDGILGARHVPSLPPMIAVTVHPEGSTLSQDPNDTRLAHRPSTSSSTISPTSPPQQQPNRDLMPRVLPLRRGLDLLLYYHKTFLAPWLLPSIAEHTFECRWYVLTDRLMGGTATASYTSIEAGSERGQTDRGGAAEEGEEGGRSGLDTMDTLGLGSSISTREPRQMTRSRVHDQGGRSGGLFKGFTEKGRPFVYVALRTFPRHISVPPAASTTSSSDRWYNMKDVIGVEVFASGDGQGYMFTIKTEDRVDDGYVYQHDFVPLVTPSLSSGHTPSVSAASGTSANQASRHVMYFRNFVLHEVMPGPVTPPPPRSSASNFLSSTLASSSSNPLPPPRGPVAPSPVLTAAKIRSFGITHSNLNARREANPFYRCGSFHIRLYSIRFLLA